MKAESPLKKLADKVKAAISPTEQAPQPDLSKPARTTERPKVPFTSNRFRVLETGRGSSNALVDDLRWAVIGDGSDEILFLRTGADELSFRLPKRIVGDSAPRQFEICEAGRFPMAGSGGDPRWVLFSCPTASFLIFKTIGCFHGVSL